MTAPIRAPLRGELLGPDDLVTVVAALHPLRTERDVLRLPAGLSLQEIAREAQAARPDIRLAGSLVAYVGGDPVPAALWPRVRIKPGVTVLLRAVPRKGGGSLFRSIALIAVAILTAFVAPYLTPILGTFGTALVTAAVTVGAGLLINALFPVNATKKDAGQVFGIAGNQNLAAKFQATPSVLGTHRVWPRYGGSAYTEFVGEDQYLRLLFDWGVGPLDVRDIKIGETPIGAFHDTEIQTLRGYPTDGDVTLYPGAVNQQDFNVEAKSRDGWTKRSTSEDTVEWALDLIAPNGLSETRNSGKVVEFTVWIEVQQSVAYAEDWKPVEMVVFTAKTARPIRKTVRRSVPRGSHDIRWRRVTPDTDGAPQITSTTAVTALRSYKPFKPLNFRKPHAVTAIRIRATSQLSGVIDNLNGVVTSRVRAWSGTAWEDDKPSSNPGSLIPHVLQGPANHRPVVAAKIDWPAFQAFHDRCIAKGYEYHRVHDTRQSILDTAQDVAAAGRGAIVIRDGLWSVIWEDPAAPLVQHFTPRNSSGFRGRRSYKRLPHAWRIRFKNADRDWRDDEIIYYAPGYGAATASLFEEVEFPGQTDHALAWRHGAYHHAQLRLRPEEYYLRVDIEGLIVTRGDRCRVSHFVPGWGLVSGRVVGIEGSTVYLDEPVTMAAGTAYSIRFRLADGTSLVRDVVVQAGRQDAVQLSGSGPLPSVGDLYTAGERTLETVILRVKAIRPGPDLTAEITFVDDAPALDAADAGTPPDPLSPEPPPGPADLTPTNLRVTEGRASTADGNAPSVTFLWDTLPGGPPIDRFEVTLKGPSDTAFGPPTTVPATERSKTWLNLPAGSTGFRVRSLFTDGTYSPPAVTTVTVIGDSGAVPDVQGFAVEIVGSTAIFSWDAPPRYVDRLELRYSPATSGATWAGSTSKGSRSGGTTMSVAFAAGTYFAAFVSAAGAVSPNPVALVVTAGSVPGTAAGEVFDMAPFGGSHVGTVEADGGVRLAYATGDALLSEGTYQPSEMIDLGAVYLARISAEVLAHGIDKTDGTASTDIYGVDPLDWDAVVETRSTRDDPTSSAALWSAWSPAADGLVTARGLQVRVRLYGYQVAISPVVEMIHLRADLDARTEFAAAVSVPASGRTVTFGADFAAVPSLQVTGRDFASGDRIVWSARSASAFTLKIQSSAGADVARSIDWLAAGYGRRLS